MADDDAPGDDRLPPGAVRGRAWHRIAVSAVVGLFVAVGVVATILALSVGGTEAKATWTAGAALSLGLAAFVVNLLVMHGLTGG